MRSGSIISIILLVGLVFTIFGLVIADFQTQYPTETVDNSTWIGFYDENYTQQINESSLRLQANLEEISDEDNWFTNVGQGLVVIPNAVLNVFGILIASMSNGAKIFIQSGVIFGIPTAVMVFGTVALIVLIVFSLINWWHSKTPL